ncbi:transporter substrate-binding domain-containing protein [Rummeliibacillus sp. NPDC094406]|uniref:transporter substrate-binding domain-containing protein n=1 Tax=Rummeliibacillus sp. NPDC094406 TaxID=3364511 RepID=UPI0038284B99
MKKFFTAIILLVALASLSACGKGAESSADSGKKLNKLEQIQKDGVINIGLEGTFPPFSFHDSKGKLTGFEYEIADQIAKDLGVKPNYVETKWDSLIAGLDTDKYDFVINNISISDERKQKYDFTIPYMISNAVLAVRKDNSEINSLKDYKGKKSAQTVTSNFAQDAKNLGAEIVPNENLTQSLDLVTQKRADGTIHDEVTFLTYLKEHPDANLRIVDGKVSSTDIALILNKNQDDFREKLNEVIQKRLDDGTFSKISEKYFNKDIMNK